MFLEVKNLSVRFPARKNFFGQTVSEVQAVSDVNFALDEGETLGIVGESGCGKTTLGRAVLGLVPASSGVIQFRGESLMSMSHDNRQHLRRNMQMIFQDPFSSLNPRFRIRDILAEPFRIHEPQLGKQDLDQRCRRLLEQVGLDVSAMSRLPHEFSGGQRQRIGIARAIALRPHLIIADEPVSALDVSIQAQIINLLQDLKRELNLSFLFISHDLSVVEHFCTRIAVMYLGRIVELASAKQIFSAPKHPYTNALLASIPNMNLASGGIRQKKILGGDIPSPFAPPQGCHFHPRCPIATERCQREAPELKQVGDKQIHEVSCHYSK